MKIKKWNKSSTEDRDEILKLYFIGFHQKTISNEAEAPFIDLSFEEMRQAMANVIIEDINNVDYTPDAIICRVLSFVFTHLDKFTVTKEKGIKKVIERNMPRNFNKLEQKFLNISIDVIIQFYQSVFEMSELTKEETDNIDLDLMNLFKKYGSAEGFSFDDKLSNSKI
jgi:hypothetical protein